VAEVDDAILERRAGIVEGGTELLVGHAELVRPAHQVRIPVGR